MGQLSEGIYATSHALRLMKKRKISEEWLLLHLKEIKEMLGVKSIEVTRYGESFALYFVMEA